MKRERPTLSHARNERDNPLTHPLYQPLHERKRHNSRLPYSTIVTWDLHLFNHHHHRSFRQKAHKAITLSAQPPPPPFLSRAAALAKFQLFRQSFSERFLVSLSPFDPLVSTPMPQSGRSHSLCHLAANFIDLCHLKYSLVCHSLLPSNPQYPSLALALENV